MFRFRVGAACMAAFVAVLASPVHADPAQMGPMAPEGGFPNFDVRYRFGQIQDFKSILDKPQITYQKVILFQAPVTQERRMEGLGECEVVYDLPLASLASVLEPQLGMEKYMPGVFQFRIEGRSGKFITTFQEVGGAFLGIKVSYTTQNETTRDELPGGAIGIRSRLTYSYDDKLFESFTSWFLAPVIVDGRQMTYIHYYMRSGVRNPFPGADVALKAFMPIQFSNTIESNVKEARRRHSRT